MYSVLHEKKLKFASNTRCFLNCRGNYRQQIQMYLFRTSQDGITYCSSSAIALHKIPYSMHIDKFSQYSIRL